MSASKKKRLGSQRRPLNPNVQDSPEASDKDTRPSVPQGRQRADAKADLPLSPSSAQSETSARKKKLGSQRANKGKLQFKDVTTESSHKPIEEAKGSAEQSQALEGLGIKHDSTDDSLGKDTKCLSPQSEAAGSDFLLNDTSNSSLSTITEAMTHKSDIQDIHMATTSDVLLKVTPSEKYMNTDIASTEEGVLSEKDQAQQMPDIFEATIPPGVTRESTCSVRLIEQEEINITGSHDHNDKHNTEKKAGPIEKPVWQDSDSSSLPSANSTKVGSSQRKKVNNVEELQEQSDETMQSDLTYALETTGFTTVDNSSEIHKTVVTDKEGVREKINSSPKIPQEKMEENLFDVTGANLPKVKFEDTQIENVFVEKKVQVDSSFDYFATIEEDTDKSEEVETLVSNLPSELSSEVESDKSPVTESKFTNETVTEFNIIEKPEPLISFSGEASFVPDQVYKKEHKNNVNLSDEQRVTMQWEEPLDFSLQIPQAVNNAQYFSADASLTDVEEAKITETEESKRSSNPVYDDSLWHDEKVEESKTAAVVQELSESDSSLKEDEQDQESDKSVTNDMSESTSEGTLFTKDETAEPMFSGLQELKPSTEGMLFLDQNKGLNSSTTTDSIGSNNKTDIAQTGDHHKTHSFVSDTLEDLLSQQSESLITLTDEENLDSSDPYKKEYTEESHELIDNLLTDRSSEPEKTLNPHTEELNVPLSSDSAASVNDVSGTWLVHNEKMEDTTPEIVIEEILDIHSTEMSLDNKDQPVGPDEMDNVSEDLNYTSKTDETGLVEIDMSDEQECTEQPVINETTEEPFETVQILDVEVNEPDTDSHHGPVRRKFGSSRRSKAKTDADNIITVGNEDSLSTESDVLQCSINLQTDDQNEPIKRHEIMKVDNAGDAELSLPNVQSPKSENEAAQDEVNESSVDVHVEAPGTPECHITNDGLLKPIEVTALFEADYTADETSNITDNQVSNSLNLEQTDVNLPNIQETPTEPKSDTEQSDVNTLDFAVKDPINVHQLTYISDTETTEELDNSLQKINKTVLEETKEEPSNSTTLVSTSDTDAHHGQRRKLGSSRRVKGRKLEVIPTDRKDIWSNDNEDANQVTEFVEACPAEAQKLEEDTKIFLLSDKDQTMHSTLEQMTKTQLASFEEKNIKDIQEKTLEEVVDSSTVKDLKAKSIVEAEGLECDVDVYNKGTQIVATSEEKVSTKIDDTMQSLVMSAEDMTKGTMDEEDSSPTMSENDAQPQTKDIVNPGDTTIAVIKDQHKSKESTERKEVTQEAQEKILQTNVELFKDMDKGVKTQTLLPIVGEEIQPSSPGKHRKMGSTRKNLSSKRESPQEDTVTSADLEREVGVSISNDNNESKEHSGLLVYNATVHQPPPDEETPLSQQINQDRSESKETELSSQQEVMSVDAAIARRRKMGSHRKPHSDQSITQRAAADSEESLLHPLGEHRAELPRLTKLSEVNEGDKVSSSATAFNARVDSRPASEIIAQHAPQPSTNVRRGQESNIRISAGFDRSAIRYEVVMIGDSSVGKTTFIQRAQSGKFSPDIPASIGMDSFKWTAIVNGKTIVLHLWDTAGQERFRSMTKQIFHRAQAFLLMYDVTCAQTFSAVSYWANCIKDGADDNAVVLLLGNKSDRVERKVTREDGQILAEENRFAFMECSAATGENVTEALETVARMLSQKGDRREEPLLLRRPEPKNKGCC